MVQVRAMHGAPGARMKGQGSGTRLLHHHALAGGELARLGAVVARG